MSSRRKQKLQLKTDDDEPVDKRRKHTENSLDPLELQEPEPFSIEEVRIKVEPVDTEIDMSLFTHDTIWIKQENQFSQENVDEIDIIEEATSSEHCLGSTHEIYIKEEDQFSQENVSYEIDIKEEEISSQHSLGDIITNDIYIKEEGQIEDEILTEESGIFSQETTGEVDEITIKEETVSEGEIDVDEVYIKQEDTFYQEDGGDMIRDKETQETILGVEAIEHADDIQHEEGDFIPQENVTVIETNDETLNAELEDIFAREDLVLIKQDDSIAQENIIVIETNEAEFSQETAFVLETEQESADNFELITIDKILSGPHLPSSNTDNHQCKLCIDPENTDTLPCYRCSRTIDLFDFTDHLKLIHKVQKPTEKYDLYLKHFHQLDAGYKPYKCAICNEYFTYSELENHVIQHHKLCNICGVGVKHDSTMDHIMKHQKQFKFIYQCLVCYNEYTFENLLLRHLRTSHPSSKPFIFQKMVPKQGFNCPYCHFSSFCFKVVSFHMQFHSKRHCRTCGKKYVPTLSKIIQDWRLLCEKCNPLDNTGQLEFISDEEIVEKLDDGVPYEYKPFQSIETQPILTYSKNVPLKKTMPSIIRKVKLLRKNYTQNNVPSTTLRQYKSKNTPITSHESTSVSTPNTPSISAISTSFNTISHENVCSKNRPSTSATSTPFYQLNTKNIHSNANVTVSDVQNKPSTSSIPTQSYYTKNIPTPTNFQQNVSVFDTQKKPSTSQCKNVHSYSSEPTCLIYVGQTSETMIPYDPINCTICGSSHTTNLDLKCYMKALIQRQTKLEQLLISCISEESKSDTLLEYKKITTLLDFLFKQDEYKKLDFVWLQRYKSAIDFLVTFDINTDQKLQCFLCNLTGIPIIKFLDHCLETHKVIYNIAARYIVKLYKFQRSGEVKYTCLLCTSYSNCDLKNIGSHVKSVHHLCRICGDFSIDLNHLKEHDKEFNSIYHCVVCHAEFTFEFSYLNHVRCAHPEQTDLILLERLKNGYDCPYCHFSSVSINILNFHLTFHKKIFCKVCKNIFVNSARHVFLAKSTEQLMCCSCDKLQIMDREIASTGLETPEGDSKSSLEFESKNQEKVSNPKKIAVIEESPVEAPPKIIQENESKNKEEIIEPIVPKNTQESKNTEEIIEFNAPKNTQSKNEEATIESHIQKSSQGDESKNHNKLTCHESTSPKEYVRTKLKIQESKNQENTLESKTPNMTQDSESKNQCGIFESVYIKKETQNSENEEEIMESQENEYKNQEGILESNSPTNTQDLQSKSVEKMEFQSPKKTQNSEIEYKDEVTCSCEKKMICKRSDESNIQKPKIFILKRTVDDTEVQVEEINHEAGTQSSEILVKSRYCVTCKTLDCEAECYIADLVKEIDKLKNDLKTAADHEKKPIEMNLLKLSSLHEFLINRGKSQCLDQNLYQTFRSLVYTLIKSEEDIGKTTQCYLCSLSTIPLLEYYDHLRVVHCIESPLNATRTFLTENVPDNNVKYQCLFCKCGPFRTIVYLKNHLRIVHNFCRICGEKQELTHQHWKHHNQDFFHIYHCLGCLKEFTSKERSDSHCNAHHFGKGKTILKLSRCFNSLECPYCHYNTSFSERVINFHLKQHRLLNCNTCGMRYVSSANDIIDANRKICNSCESKKDIAIMATSETDAILPCLYCDEVIENRFELFSHMLSTHRACLQCNQQFESLVAWTSHNNVTHLLNYKCAVCHAIITSDSLVEMHARILHSSLSRVEFVEFENKDNIPVTLQSMQCPYCLLFRNSDGELNYHIMNGHNVKKCDKCSIKLVVAGQTLCRKCDSIV